MKEHQDKKVEEALIVLRRLKTEYVHGYGPSSIPNQIDEEVELLLESFGESREEGIVLEDMTEVHGFVLLAYAERMASEAIRQHSADVLAKGMKALTIGGKLVYGKEVLPVLALMDNSARKLGVASLELLCDLSREDDGELLRSVQNFSKRSNEDRSIQAMGYSEGQDQGGFRYRRNW